MAAMYLLILSLILGVAWHIAIQYSRLVQPNRKREQSLHEDETGSPRGAAVHNIGLRPDPGRRVRRDDQSSYQGMSTQSSDSSAHISSITATGVTSRMGEFASSPPSLTRATKDNAAAVATRRSDGKPGHSGSNRSVGASASSVPCSVPDFKTDQFFNAKAPNNVFTSSNNTSLGDTQAKMSTTPTSSNPAHSDEKRRLRAVESPLPLFSSFVPASASTGTYQASHIPAVASTAQPSPKTGPRLREAASTLVDIDPAISSDSHAPETAQIKTVPRSMAAVPVATRVGRNEAVRPASNLAAGPPGISGRQISPPGGEEFDMRVHEPDPIPPTVVRPGPPSDAEVEAASTSSELEDEPTSPSSTASTQTVTKLSMLPTSANPQTTRLEQDKARLRRFRAPTETESSSNGDVNASGVVPTIMVRGSEVPLPLYFEILDIWTRTNSPRDVIRALLDKGLDLNEYYSVAVGIEENRRIMDGDTSPFFNIWRVDVD